MLYFKVCLYHTMLCAWSQSRPDVGFSRTCDFSNSSTLGLCETLTHFSSAERFIIPSYLVPRG
jgi:hypothetical protein